MSNLSKTIGKNIRNLRQGKQLTQAELSGNEITRNMLSLIESGNANPSLSTLEYLSKKLEVPIGYFFTDDEEQSSYQIKQEIIDNIRNLYSNHEYEKCAELCHSMEIMDDEIAYIYAHSKIMLGKDSCKKFNLGSAIEHFSLATMATEYTSYDSIAINQTATFYLRLIETVQEENVSPLLTEMNQYSLTNITAEYFIFLNQLKTLIDTNDNTIDFHYELKSPIYSGYITAKRFIIKKDYVSAIPYLRALYLNEDTDFYILYKVCCDLELCSKQLEDYKSAYQYSKKLSEMLDKFKK